MSKSTLFICKSCNATHSDNVDYDRSAGATLLRQIQTLHQTWIHRDELEIQAVGCLWTCDRSCAVAFSAANKATYLFTKVPTNADDALLQFGELYLNRNDGDIPWKQFPEALQSGEVAKIPPVFLKNGNEE